MRFAINKNGFITNVIVAKSTQKAELETALGAILEDASVYGLKAGDLWVEGKGWTRNVNGEQIILNTLPTEDRSQYKALYNELDDLKANSMTIEELEDAYSEGVQSL